MIVFDASAMIAALDGQDAHFAAAKRILVDHVDNRLLAHRLTLAETLARAVHAGRGIAVAAALATLGVEPVDDLDDPLELAELRAGTGLRMPDACVLLAARRAQASVATFDARLAAAAHARGIPVVGVP